MPENQNRYDNPVANDRLAPPCSPLVADATLFAIAVSKAGF